MKHENLPGGITRRSFIKRSVVAAVAAANLTILTGLVDAADTAGSGSIEVNGVKCYGGKGGVYWCKVDGYWTKCVIA